MFTVTRDQTIALAGLYQALALTQSVARDGNMTDSCLPATLESVLKIDAQDYLDVYGMAQNLRLGLRMLSETAVNRNDASTIERTRHAVSLMHLESQLNADAKATRALGDDIRAIATLYDAQNTPVQELAQDLGRMYQAHISPLGPKVIIKGNPSLLKTDEYASMIRALLLAAIRAIALWRHAQGKRLSLLLGKASMFKHIETLKKEGLH